MRRAAEQQEQPRARAKNHPGMRQAAANATARLDVGAVQGRKKATVGTWISMLARARAGSESNQTIHGFVC